MLVRLKGITFRSDYNTEIKKLRPQGSVSFVKSVDPEVLKHDENAIEVWYKNFHIGFVPAEKIAQEQALKHKTAKIVSYAYFDPDCGFNEKHIGDFQAMTFQIGSTDVDNNGRIYGGDYVRITSFIKAFDPYMSDGFGLMKYAFDLGKIEDQEGSSFDLYRERQQQVMDDGTKMHLHIEEMLLHGTRGSALPEGWDNFVKKYQPEIAYRDNKPYLEIRKFDNDLMVTGQCDMVGYVTIKGERKRVVVDWKSSKKPHLKHLIQGSFYAMNNDIDGEPIEGVLVVAFGSQTKQKFSASYIDREQIESNYQALTHIRKALDCVGAYIRDLY
tara:strand:+ start:1211 stop:2194 length:984 start_codon:yes stop_codon:yes gene_type:complete